MCERMRVAEFPLCHTCSARARSSKMYIINLHLFQAVLVSIKNRIALLSNPKCGTTSIEHALSGKCEIRTTNTAYFKHTDAVTFSKIWKPFLNKELGIHDLLTICSTRSPSSKLLVGTNTEVYRNSKAPKDT